MYHFSRKWISFADLPVQKQAEIVCELTLKNEPAKYQFDQTGHGKCRVTTFSSMFKMWVDMGYRPKMLFAWTDEKLVGWVAFFTVQNTFMFYVHPLHRRQGIAKRLARTVKRLTHRIITIGDGNEASQHFKKWLHESLNKPVVNTLEVCKL